MESKQVKLIVYLFFIVIAAIWAAILISACTVKGKEKDIRIAVKFCNSNELDTLEYHGYEGALYIDQLENKQTVLKSWYDLTPLAYGVCWFKELKE